MESLAVPQTSPVDPTKLKDTHPKPISTPVHGPDEIIESHPNPFSTPVNNTDIIESHPNPFSTPTGFPKEKKHSLTILNPEEQKRELEKREQKHSKEFNHDILTDMNSPVSLSSPTRLQGAHKKFNLSITLPTIEKEEVRDGIVRQQRQSYGPGDFGDEVMIEFGRPRLKEGIRPWAEGFGRRACIYGKFTLFCRG